MELSKLLRKQIRVTKQQKLLERNGNPQLHQDSTSPLISIADAPSSSAVLSSIPTTKPPQTPNEIAPFTTITAAITNTSDVHTPIEHNIGDNSAPKVDKVEEESLLNIIHPPSAFEFIDTLDTVPYNQQQLQQHNNLNSNPSSNNLFNSHDNSLIEGNINDVGHTDHALDMYKIKTTGEVVYDVDSMLLLDTFVDVDPISLGVISQENENLLEEDLPLPCGSLTTMLTQFARFVRDVQPQYLVRCS